MERLVERNTMRRQVEVLKSDLEREFPVREIIGQSPVFQRALGNN